MCLDVQRQDRPQQQHVCVAEEADGAHQQKRGRQQPRAGGRDALFHRRGSLSHAASQQSRLRAAERSPGQCACGNQYNQALLVEHWVTLGLENTTAGPPARGETAVPQSTLPTLGTAFAILRTYIVCPPCV